jgi:hypothetical protein
MEIDLKNNYMERLYTIKNFLTEDECSKILKKYKSELTLKPAEVVGEFINCVNLQPHLLIILILLMKD